MKNKGQATMRNQETITIDNIIRYVRVTPTTNNAILYNNEQTAYVNVAENSVAVEIKMIDGQNCACSFDKDGNCIGVNIVLNYNLNDFDDAMKQGDFKRV